MADHAIPIGQQRQKHGSLLGTSLDMVWSYSRSTAFIGSQMPSSPSFVARYLPRGTKGSNTDTEDGSIARTYSNDDESLQELDEDGSDSYSEEDDIGPMWASTSEALPPNAIARQKEGRKRRRSSRRSAKGSTVPASSASETSALLATAPDYPVYGSSPPEEVPFARRNSALKAHMRKSLSSIRGDSALAISEAGSDYGDDTPGMSTFAQSLFNSINVLVGVAILAEPLAFAHAGWILGVLITLFCALVTNYTAKILAKLIRSRSGLSSYIDIGALAFGDGARMGISLLFALELSSLSVALVVLFGDSMSFLIPRLSSNEFKLIGFFIICPTVFLPLRFLSVTSLIGIVSCITLLVVVYVDGALKREAPGSLRHPVHTNVGPDWPTLPLTFGLIMSGFAGHAVMPSLAKDMKSPKQFNSMINLAYLFSTIIYLLMAVAGFLMFGQDSAQEISQNLLSTPGYPRTVTRLAVWTIAINPLCKFALGIRPLTTTIEYMLGIDQDYDKATNQEAAGSDVKADEQAGESTLSPPASFRTEIPKNNSGSRAKVQRANSSAFSRISLTEAPKPIRATVSVLVKIITTALVVATAIFWPGFESVMSFLGAFSAFVICVLIPISANLVLNRKEMSWSRIVFEGVLFAISTVMCIVGTIFSFLPSR